MEGEKGLPRTAAGSVPALGGVPQIINVSLYFLECFLRGTTEGRGGFRGLALEHEDADELRLLPEPLLAFREEADGTVKVSSDGHAGNLTVSGRVDAIQR